MEDLKSQERQMAYQEMRANHSVQADTRTASSRFAENGDYIFQIENGQSCLRGSFDE